MKQYPNFCNHNERLNVGNITDSYSITLKNLVLKPLKWSVVGYLESANIDLKVALATPQFSGVQICSVGVLLSVCLSDIDWSKKLELPYLTLRHLFFWYWSYLMYEVKNWFNHVIFNREGLCVTSMTVYMYQCWRTHTNTNLHYKHIVTQGKPLSICI